MTGGSEAPAANPFGDQAQPERARAGFGMVAFGDQAQAREDMPPGLQLTGDCAKTPLRQHTLFVSRGEFDYAFLFHRCAR